jgi:D-glycero-D-manno-heptose 1,7-bisphosphate phosphatase
MLDLKQINKSWTLFLDRDGVINQEKPGDYVCHWSEFIFYPGVIQAIAYLSSVFDKIIVATNQRAVAKGLMAETELQDIHSRMVQQIAWGQGRIDKIYYCLALDDSDPCRKPNPGMARQAQQDFPEIVMSKSLMVGNTISDMEFGRNAEMHTVYVRTTNPHVLLPHPAIDLSFADLPAFAIALGQP